MYSYDAHSEQSLMPHPSLVHMQVQLGISWMTTTWKMHSSIEFLIYSSLPHSKSKSRSKFLSQVQRSVSSTDTTAFNGSSPSSSAAKRGRPSTSTGKESQDSVDAGPSATQGYKTKRRGDMRHKRETRTWLKQAKERHKREKARDKEK